MAEKTARHIKAKTTFNNYKEKLWELMVAFIEEEIKNLESWIKNINHLKHKIKRYIISFLILFGGIILVLLGLGEYVAETLRLPNSIGYIVIGFVAIIAAMIYNKM